MLHAVWRCLLHAVLSRTFARRLAGELVGTCLLLVAVVGSGIMAQSLSSDVGVRLLANSVATAGALVVLVAVFGPVSGAHLNPAVSLGLAARGAFPRREVGPYAAAQVLGAILGVVLANVMFSLAPVTLSRHTRGGAGQWLGEVVATAGLLMVVAVVSRPGRAAWAPGLVASWILGAYWFTSSTSFANPAVTIARSLTDTFAGISPGSVPGFVVAELVGVVVGLGLVGLVASPVEVVGPAVVVESGSPVEETL